MPPATSSPVPSKSLNPTAQQASNRYRESVEQGVRLKIHQLIQARVLHAARPNKQCKGTWKPRMDLIDDPSSPNIIAIFELPGVTNENITLQIKDKRLVVVGKRIDPFSEALALAASSESRTQTPSASNAAESLTKDPPGPLNADGSSTGGPVTSPKNTSIRELRYGSFFRRIPVPEGIKQSEVSAGIQDGMLTVAWPRVPTVARTTGPGVKATPAPSAGSIMHSKTTEAIPATHPAISSQSASMLQ